MRPVHWFLAGIISLLSVSLPGAAPAAPAAAGGDSRDSLERRLRYLEESLALNQKGRERYPMTTLHDRTWHDWQKRTGELPPDFALMPSRPYLPDPLVWMGSDGETTPIQTVEDWQRKRHWIREQFQQWICGSVPPPPGNVTAVILEDQQEPGQARTQMIELRFGPENRARMTVELLIPPGDGPRPVYMTQWNHRDWAALAVRRGYIGCVYAGADAKDDTEAYQALYPDYEFSRLMRRAWGASRVVDYLLTRPEVNAKQIAITGHSRNGKQSLWAAAFDDRIGAVITSSCGTGGITPWRFSDPQFCNETIDAIAGVANTWFHPRLRFFFGREDKLPIDQNELIALIAPRPLLVHYSPMERQLNPWVVEQCYHSVRSVYEFLGAKDNIGIHARAGEHAVAARDQERCLDFLDLHFGRGTLPWHSRLFFHYDFETWKAAQRDDVLTSASRLEAVRLKERYADLAEFARDRERILEKLDWLLGDEPPGARPRVIAPTEPSRVDWMDRITGRPVLQRARVLNIGPYTAMGDHMPGNLYYPATEKGTTASVPGGKFPVIIYLHQYAYSHGYAVGYYHAGSGGSRRVLQKMVDDGFAVLAIDMFGFGTRLEEALYFYSRHKAWSKMGKMVTDVSACVDAVGSFDFLDPDRVYVVGDTIGGAVGLMAAARDPRIAGVAVVAAFSPWRSSNSRYESIRLFSHWHGFMPRLGLFADRPEEAPVDYPEILAALAPRKLMVVAPTLDRHSNGEAVTRTLEQVAKVYELHGARDRLRISRPTEINRMMPAMEEEILRFLKQDAAP